MKETVSEEKIDDLKPNMATLEKLDLLEVTPNQTIVTAKLDGEFTLLVYDRNGESYTLNKWGRRRTDFPALNQLVEALKQTQLNHVRFLCELYAVEDNKPAKLPQFIRAIKGDRDFDKIHIGIWDLLSIDGKDVTAQPFDWKLQEVEGWLKNCTHVAVVPFILPRTLQDVKDFWNEYVKDKGYEGLVIRNGKQVSKIKPTLEVDAIIIGLNKKTSYGKNLDLFEQAQITSIKLALMQPDGTFLELSDCASGITADLRTVLWKLMEFKVSEDDKTVFIKPMVVCTIQYSDTFPRRREILKFDGEYKFRGYTQFISLREPRLIRFRPDKNANPNDVGVGQIPENKLPKPEEKKTQPQQISKTNTPIVRETMPMEVPRIVKPQIVMSPNESFNQASQRLYAEKWMVNSNLKADTLEEAVELQAKSFPCIEFQPVQLPDGKWVAFHRTTVQEWMKSQEQKPKQSTTILRVKGEGFDAYWQRNNTCVDHLTSLILKKMTPEMLRQMTHSCGGDNAIEGINQQLQDECWSKLEHPEWFGKHGSPYYIKPYLALCVKLGLGDEAYKFLNEGTAFPRMPPEEYEEAHRTAEEKAQIGEPKDKAPEKPTTETIVQQLPCDTGECDKCPDPCTDKCSMGIPLSQAGKDEVCLTCQTRDCEPTEQPKEQPKLKPIGLEQFF